MDTLLQRKKTKSREVAVATSFWVISLIPEIRKNVLEGQYRLKIILDVKDEKAHRIVATFTPSRILSYRRHEMVNFTVKNRRLAKLANDILAHLNKEERRKKWQPTMEELQSRLDEIYHGEGMYMWFIDWCRKPWNKETVKKIYGWLKSNEEWVMC